MKYWTEVYFRNGKEYKSNRYYKELQSKSVVFVSLSTIKLLYGLPRIHSNDTTYKECTKSEFESAIKNFIDITDINLYKHKLI